MDTKKKKILVAGDIMLDIYSFGKATHISPEAPVPVFRLGSKDREYVLGGAANVARNIIASGVPVSVMSVVGEDDCGKRLLQLLKRSGIDISCLLYDETRVTTSKLRYIGQNNQQLLRVDSENYIETDIDDFFGVFSDLERNISQYSVLVLSDYKKGFLSVKIAQYLIELGNKNRIPVLIDVKDTNVEKYKNATLVKPNRDELRLLTDEDTDTLEGAVAASCTLCRRLSCKYVLATLGADGMILVNERELIKRVSSKAREVYDVTGAGDTSIAYLASELSKGKEIPEAMDVANYAAGIQVSKMGTSVVYYDEIQSLIDTCESINECKILDVHSLEGMDKLKKMKLSDKKIVFTNGCFDILHAGHVDYLKRSKALGDILIIGINSDSSIKRIKGDSRPVNCLKYRIELLAALEFVDYVVPFNEDTPLELIKMIEPDVLVKGGDYCKEDIVGYGFVKKNGGEVCTIPLLEGLSTTNIMEKIKNQAWYHLGG